MKIRRSILALLPLTMLVACGGDAPPKSPENATAASTTASPVDPQARDSHDKAPPAVPSNPPVEPQAPPPDAPVAADRIVIELTPRPDKAPQRAELDASGAGTLDGKLVLRILPDRVERADGKRLMTRNADGSLVIHDGKTKDTARFEGETLIGNEGERIQFNGDTLVLVKKSGKVKPFPGRFLSLPPGKKREAILFAASLMFVL